MHRSLMLLSGATLLSCGSFGTTSDPPTPDAASSSEASTTADGAPPRPAEDGGGGGDEVFRETFEANGCSAFTGDNANLADVPGMTGKGCRVCRANGLSDPFSFYTRNPLPKASGRFELEASIKLETGAFIPRVGFLVDGAQNAQAGASSFTTGQFTRMTHSLDATATQELKPGVFVGKALVGSTACFIVDDVIVTRK